MRDSDRNTLLFQALGRGRFMSGTTKRLDLQFGSFACSVQGFDDPVQPVQQVLQALQNLLEETPELSDAGISFDAEAIERLIGEVARRADLDENTVEIVPGLIIVHRRHNAAAGYPDTNDDAHEDTRFDRAVIGKAGVEDADSSAAGADEDDAWTPLVAHDAGEGIAAAPTDPAEADDADPGYVNIFALGGRTEGKAAARPSFGLFQTAADDTSGPIEDEDPEVDLQNDPFTARLGKITAAEDDSDDFRADDQKNDPAPDIFADSGTGDGGSVFADPMAVTSEAEAGHGDAPINFFSTSDRVDQGAKDGSGDSAGYSAHLFASAAPDDANAQDTEQPAKNPGRGEALFGRTEDQPEDDEADEGYTAAGLAKTAGAESVSDLMVSAAAWMVLIQGQTTFTRNEVVEVFESMPGEHEKTLEARVKGFGKAVRNGRLVLVEEGVFGLSRTELERFQRLL
jgi:hypothetical protein